MSKIGCLCMYPFQMAICASFGPLLGPFFSGRNNVIELPPWRSTARPPKRPQIACQHQSRARASSWARPLIALSSSSSSSPPPEKALLIELWVCVCLPSYHPLGNTKDSHGVSLAFWSFLFFIHFLSLSISKGDRQNHCTCTCS